MILPWTFPFTAIAAGPSQCGKSTFCKKFIEYLPELVNERIDEIIYCSPIVKQYNISNDKIRCFETVPELESFTDGKKRLIILDDMMREANNDVVDLFTKGSHHFNLGIFNYYFYSV